MFPITFILSLSIAAAAEMPKPLSAPFTKAEADKARAAWAKYLHIPERKDLELSKHVKLELMLIPPAPDRRDNAYGFRICVPIE